MSDLISRADALNLNCVITVRRADTKERKCDDEIIKACFEAYVEHIKKLPSADAEQGWRIGKPTEQGEYIVTVDSMRHGMVELMYYGKPVMPNCKVRGKCWHRSDDEWGDVVYDDTDILAWQPLPKPYKGGDE